MKTANNEHLFENLDSSFRFSLGFAIESSTLLNELMYNMFYDSKNEIVYIVLPETHEHIQNMLFGYKCRCQYCKYNECKNSKLYFNDIDDNDGINDDKNKNINDNNNNDINDNDDNDDNNNDNDNVKNINLSEVSTIYINNIDDLYKYDLLQFNGLIVCESLEQIPEHLKTKLIHYDDDLIKFKDPDVPYFSKDYCRYNKGEDYGDCFYNELLSTNIATNYEMAKKCILATFIDVIDNNGIVWEESDEDDEGDYDEDDSFAEDSLKNESESDSTDYEDEFHFRSGRLRYLYIDLDIYLPVLKEYFDNYEYITHSSKPHPNHLNELKMFQKDEDNDDDKYNKEYKEKTRKIIQDNDEDKEKENNKEIDYYSLLVCLNFIGDDETLINLTKTCKKYSNILESCGTNLTPNYKLFKNAIVYTFHNSCVGKSRCYSNIEDENECEFPIVLPKYERYNIQEIFNTNLFYQLFRNNSKFHFKSILYMEYSDSNKESRYYCDLNDINMLYINVNNNSNLEYISNKIEIVSVLSCKGSLDLRKCKKLKHVYTYINSSNTGLILLPKHLK
jgi:hypothetical protein